MSTATRTALQGGEFLIRESDPQDIFIPEEFNEEQRMIAEASWSSWPQRCGPTWTASTAWRKG
jgi:hypothetical protein